MQEMEEVSDISGTAEQGEKWKGWQLEIIFHIENRKKE